MNVSLPQEFFRKTAKNSPETVEPSSLEDIPDKNFRELLQVIPIDEKPREKDLFSILKEEEEKIIDGLACLQISLNPSQALSEQKKEQNQGIDAIAYAPPFAFLHSSSSIAAAHMQSILPPEIELIFEKMASNMILMSSSGEVETTLFLDNPSSIFFGTKITIREFSTAPKTFNIEITSFTAAINAIESSKNDLLSAFQNGKFNFSVHRCETYIQNEDRPVLHRKENSDHDNQERKGDREE